MKRKWEFIDDWLRKIDYESEKMVELRNMVRNMDSEVTLITGDKHTPQWERAYPKHKKDVEKMLEEGQIIELIAKLKSISGKIAYCTVCHEYMIKWKGYERCFECPLGKEFGICGKLDSFWDEIDEGFFDVLRELRDEEDDW